jgi:hypothetical protein
MAAPGHPPKGTVARQLASLVVLSPRLLHVQLRRGLLEFCCQSSKHA